MRLLPLFTIPRCLAASTQALLFIAAASVGFQPASSARAAGGIPGYVVLPLSLMDQSNQATVRANLDGQNTMLILDTGASGTLLDEHFYKGAHKGTAFVKKEDLPPELQKHGVNANGQHAEIGVVDSLKAGSVEFGKRSVVVTDLSASFGQYNARHQRAAVSGLLGEDFLRQYAAVIDWGRRGVYLNTEPARRMKFGPSLVSAGWTPVPMSATDARHYTVQAEVENKPVRLIVDTGAQFTTFAPNLVPLPMKYNRDTGGSIGHLSSCSATMSMVGGNATMHLAQLNRWKIGGYEVPSSIVAVNILPAGILAQQSAGEGPILGLLGCEVLAKNHAIIDIAGSTLYLKSK